MVQVVFLTFVQGHAFFGLQIGFFGFMLVLLGGFSLFSNPLLHMGFCNSAAVLHYKTGRTDSIEFAGPPDDLQEHGIQDA
jgi:hypothetical protein